MNNQSLPVPDQPKPCTSPPAGSSLYPHLPEGDMETGAVVGSLPEPSEHCGPYPIHPQAASATSSLLQDSSRGALGSSVTSMETSGHNRCPHACYSPIPIPLPLQPPPYYWLCSPSRQVDHPSCLASSHGRGHQSGEPSAVPRTPTFTCYLCHPPSQVITQSYKQSSTTFPHTLPSHLATYQAADETTPLLASSNRQVVRSSGQGNVESADGAGSKMSRSSRFHKKQLLILISMLVVVVASFASMSVMAPFFPHQVEKRGLSETIDGFIFSTYPFVVVIISPIIGKILPVLHLRDVYLVGITVNGLATISFGMVVFIPQVDVFVAVSIGLRMLAALGTSLFLTVIYALVPIVFPELGIVSNCGTGGVWAVLSWPLSSISLLILCSAAVCSAGLYPTLQPHMSTLGVSVEGVGIVYLILSAVYAVASPLVGLAIDRYGGHSNFMLVGLLLTALSFILIGNSPLLPPPPSHDELYVQDIIGMVLFGVSSALCIVPTYGSILQAASSARGAVDMGTYSVIGGLWSASYSLGEVLGPVCAALLAEHVTFATTTTITALLPASLDELSVQLSGLQVQEGQRKVYGGSVGRVGGAGGTDGGTGRGRGNTSGWRGGAKEGNRGRGRRAQGAVLRRMSETKEQVVWTRPQHILNKKGTSGQGILLRTNYYQVMARPDWCLCVYHATFTPDESRTAVRKLLLRQHTATIGHFIFDGTQMFLARKLNPDPLELASLRPDTGLPYIIKIKFIREIPPSDTQFLQIFSILLRRCYEYLGLTQVGRHYYDATREVQNLKHQVAVWPGQVSSIRQHEHQVLMMADVIHKFLRLDTVYTMLRRLHTSHPNNLKWVAGREVVGLVVMTRYNQRTYTINEIAWDLNCLSKFTYEGAQTTYLDYYQKTYQVTIQDPRQPLLLSKPRKKDLRRGQQGNIYLVPELCVATGVSQAMRSDPRLMQELAASTRLGPDQRVDTLTKFNNSLFTNDKVKGELEQWGLNFSRELVQVRGRVLPGELLSQAHRTFTYTGRDGDWAREVKDVPLSVRREVSNWVLVYPARLRHEAEDLLAGLKRVTPTLGMMLTQPAMVSLQQDTAQDYIHALGRHVGVSLVVCVLSNTRLDRYASIKRHICSVLAAPSQMVLAKSLQHKGRLLAIVSRVAIQINCKLGGEAWTVQIPLKNTMVVGYDAYHEGGRRGGSSWGAVVASYNQSLTRYYGQVTRHASHQELTTNFSAAITNALGHYARVNGCLPERVLVYRDGVGEGQLAYVRDTEVAAIKTCFAALNFKPGFSFIVVSKRIHSRLFAEGATSGRPVNPPPGTVCDDVITLPERYDFFLVSQRVTEGTVTPTSYNILEDSGSNLDPDRHQRLAYKLTFLYYNWMGPVRVPAPCLYAHKLASITGQAIHGSPPASLADKLWYL